MAALGLVAVWVLGVLVGQVGTLVVLGWLDERTQPTRTTARTHEHVEADVA